MALELSDCVGASSEPQTNLFDLAESTPLGDIPIDLRLVVLQIACLPQVVKQRASLIDKVEKYYLEELRSQSDSELKLTTLCSLLQSANVDKILTVLDDCIEVKSCFPQQTEVARGLQVIHLQVRDRLKASQIVVEERLDTMIAEEQTNAASLKEKASNVFTALLSLYPA